RPAVAAGQEPPVGAETQPLPTLMALAAAGQHQRLLAGEDVPQVRRPVRPGAAQALTVRGPAHPTGTTGQGEHVDRPGVDRLSRAQVPGADRSVTGDTGQAVLLGVEGDAEYRPGSVARQDVARRAGAHVPDVNGRLHEGAGRRVAAVGADGERGD